MTALTRWVFVRTASLGIVAWTVGSAGCGTDAVGVDACRQIEEARCHAAPGCGVALGPPYSTSSDPVGACVRFYDDACLHGLSNGNDPGPAAVHDCVTAIDAHPCPPQGPNLVRSPQSDPACTWLSAAVAPVTNDAGDETSATGNPGSDAAE